jgi:hypothetical protein
VHRESETSKRHSESNGMFQEIWLEYLNKRINREINSSTSIFNRFESNKNPGVYHKLLVSLLSMLQDAISITSNLSLSSVEIIHQIAQTIEYIIVKIQSTRVIRVACKVLSRIIELNAFETAKVSTDQDDTFIKRIIKRIGQYLLVNDERAHEWIKSCIEPVKVEPKSSPHKEKKEKNGSKNRNKSKSSKKPKVIDINAKYRVYISMNNTDDDFTFLIIALYYWNKRKHSIPKYVKEGENAPHPSRPKSAYYRGPSSGRVFQSKFLDIVKGVQDSIKETENLDERVKASIKHFYNKIFKITKYAMHIEKNLRTKSISSILSFLTKDEAEEFANLLYLAYNGELDPITVDPYFKNVEKSKELLDSQKFYRSISNSKKSDRSIPKHNPIPGQGPLVKLARDR